MKTPLINTVLLVTSLFLISACSNDSSNGNSSGDGQQKVGIALKDSSTKIVLVDSVKNLRKYLVNGDSATFTVQEGEGLVEWTDEAAKLHFLQAGTVRVLAVNPGASSGVEIAFDVTTDENEAGLDLDDNGDEP